MQLVGSAYSAKKQRPNSGLVCPGEALGARDRVDPELTGLEPATSAVTGRRSNQLSYNSSEKVVTVELNLGGFNRKFLGKG